MTTRKKKKQDGGGGGGFLKKVSSLFNLDTVMQLWHIVEEEYYSLGRMGVQMSINLHIYEYYCDTMLLILFSQPVPINTSDLL